MAVQLLRAVATAERMRWPNEHNERSEAAGKPWAANYALRFDRRLAV